MKNLIYYPTFEPQNTDWIKFALLYIDKLNPIIPETGDVELTEITKKLSQETDLIKRHLPSREEGTQATIYALEEIEKILFYPERYSRIFHSSDILSSWRNKNNYTHELFNEKYNYEFEKFVLSNRLGIKTGSNVLLPKELAHIYMSIIAQVIADDRGISPITDNEDLYVYSIFTRQSNQSNTEHFNLAHQIIQLKLPENITDISLDKFILFRNRKGFKERQLAFHNELNDYLNRLENDGSAEEFIKKYKHILKEFTGDFIELGSKMTTIFLGVWLLYLGNANITYDSIQQIIGSMAVGGSVISINQKWQNAKSKIYCKNYLANLKTIK